MNKNQYVDSVMRVLGNSSIELTLDDLEELQILLESEYDRVLESEYDGYVEFKTYLSQRISDLSQRISESKQTYS